MNSSSKGIRTWITLPYHLRSLSEKIPPTHSLSKALTVLPRRAPFCGVASEAKLFLFLAHEPSPSMACQCHEPDQNSMLVQRVVRQNITAHDDPELGPRGSSVF